MRTSYADSVKGSGARHYLHADGAQHFQRGQIGQLEAGRQFHGADNFPTHIEDLDDILFKLHDVHLQVASCDRQAAVSAAAWHLF